MEKSALISPCGRYRYWLNRRWNVAAPRIVFVMLNPSTADASVDDPTIRKCVGFAQRWGYGELTVVNLFAFRATNPRELILHSDGDEHIGPECDAWIAKAVKDADVVCGWGARDEFELRIRAVRMMLRASDSVSALKLTKAGHPQHPLYVPYNVERKEFDL